MPMLKITERTLTQDWLAAGRERLVIRDEELPGFIATVGRRRTTFAVDFRAGKTRRLMTIGVYGRPVPDTDATWNVQRARQKARELLGQVAGGTDPTEPERRRLGGPTLRDGLELHLRNMVKRRASDRSTETLEQDVLRHLADWLDRPISDLTGLELNRLHDGIKARATRRAGAHEANAPGASLANRVIRHVSAIWNALDRVEPFDGRNPTRAVVRDDVVPRGTRINDGEFAAWYVGVQAITNAVRRDLQLFALMTGARSSSARNVRWEHVDRKASVVTFAIAKGGKPYAVPLGSRALELLARRELENAKEFEPWGGDHGYVFPSLSRCKDARGKLTVQPVAEAKEYRRTPTEDDKVKKVRILPPLHDLRRTYNSVAIEIGVPKESRHMLLNHERQGVNVKHYGFPQDWSNLAAWQAKIEAAIWERVTPATPTAPA